MPPIPAPDPDQLALPPYGVRFPKPGYKANKLPNAFEDIAEDITTVLVEFGIPPVVNGSVVTAASAAARDAHWGAPATAAARRALQDLGAITIRLDTGYTEQYFAGPTDGGANPGGAVTAGWYPILGRMPQGSLKRSTSAYSLANNTVTKIIDLVTNINDGVTVGTGAGELTIVKPGRYQVGVGLVFLANATGARLLFMNKNSTTYNTNPLIGQGSGGSASSNAFLQGHAIADLAAGDILRIWGYQNSGGSLAIPGDGGTVETAPGSFMYARYLGPST